MRIYVDDYTNRNNVIIASAILLYVESRGVSCSVARGMDDYVTCMVTNASIITRNDIYTGDTIEVVTDFVTKYDSSIVAKDDDIDWLIIAVQSVEANLTVGYLTSLDGSIVNGIYNAMRAYTLIGE